MRRAILGDRICHLPGRPHGYRQTNHRPVGKIETHADGLTIGICGAAPGGGLEGIRKHSRRLFLGIGRRVVSTDVCTCARIAFTGGSVLNRIYLALSNPLRTKNEANTDADDVQRQYRHSRGLVVFGGGAIGFLAAGYRVVNHFLTQHNALIADANAVSANELPADDLRHFFFILAAEVADIDAGLDDVFARHSGGLVVFGDWAIGRSDNGPGHVGAQVFAAHGAMGRGFDGGAILGRHTLTAPVLQRLVCVQPKDGRGFTQPTHVVNCSLKVGGSVIHAATLPQEKLAMLGILAVTQEIIAPKMLQ